MNIKEWANIPNNRLTDIEEPEMVQIVIRDDGKTLWVNTEYGCLVRICQIKGKVTVEDKRRKKRNNK